MKILIIIFLLSIPSLILFGFLKKPHFNSFTFHPEKKIYSTPSDLGYTYKENYINVSNNKIYYWTIEPQTKPIASIIQAHGNAQNMSTHFYSMIWFLKQGYRVVTFDYRGFGNSTGKPTRSGDFSRGARLSGVS